LKNSQTKPVVIAGFFIVVPILMAALNASAQDFIDLEAEREGSAAVSASTTTVKPSVQACSARRRQAVFRSYDHGRAD
jgi:hypothetical protein